MSKIKLWNKFVNIEDNAMQQIHNVASMPFVHHHVAVMPDAHCGMGCTVGSVIPTINAIIPAAVGVDIGCGMMARKTTLKAEDLPDNLSLLRGAIESAVPHGRSNGGRCGDVGANKNCSLAHRMWVQTGLSDGLENIQSLHPKIMGNTYNHLGTLGTGNHFIELCLDEYDNVWVMLHSGSRGIGNAIGNYFINLAKEEMIDMLGTLPDKDLAYFNEGKHLNDYIQGVKWAQKFAQINREIMMAKISQTISGLLPGFKYSEQAINCHHNYISREFHYGEDCYITRKGAVNAEKGVLGIIPGSMGNKSYIVRGLGNPESFNSCSHGAGRVMSRNEAKKSITIEEHIKATEGVECRKDESVIDESPAAYKDIDDVMRSQEDLVEIVYTLKQVLCVKG